MADILLWVAKKPAASTIRLGCNDIKNSIYKIIHYFSGLNTLISFCFSW